MTNILQFPITKPSQAFFTVTYVEQGGYKLARRYDCPEKAAAFFWQVCSGSAIAGVLKNKAKQELIRFNRAQGANLVTYVSV